MTRRGIASVAVLASLALAAPGSARPRAEGGFAEPPPPRRRAPTRAFVHDVQDRQTFETYSKIIGSDRFGKFIIDLHSDEIYFIDVNIFRIHADFVLGVLLKQPWTAANVRAYNLNYEREKPQFILGYVTEHLKIGKFTFAFWEGDKIDAAGIARARKKLASTFFQKDLAFRPDSPAQVEVSKEVARLGIPVLTSDALYRSAPYQSLNNGRAIGTLRVVPRGTPYESLLFDRHDIVVLQEAYPDISPVAGILSTRPSTPLAHVNLRARAWDIPNASFNKAYERYAKLDGQVVYYEVSDRAHSLRKATPAEVTELRTTVEKRRKVRVPKPNLTDLRMPMLTHISAAEATTFGAKTANLGEIASGGLGEVHVPPGFGLPFAYYVRHLQAHGLDRRIDSMLRDPRWKDVAWRKDALEKLRAAIVKAPMDPKVIGAIYKRVRLKLGGRGVFVRSSTNAEDLPGFNGAGLYDTVPNVRGKAALEEAVKTVWASLWNFRAVEERSLFGIDHRDAFPGVLIQMGVNASAAGVLITANLFDPSDSDSYTINAKWGLGIRVVQGTRVPEQIIYDTSNYGTKIISRSDDPVMLVFDEKGGIRELPTTNKGVILSEERARVLAETVKRFLPLFPPTYPLDVEWLLEGEKVWIVQARPYVGRL